MVDGFYYRTCQLFATDICHETLKFAFAKELGVNVIWLSAVYKSNDDNGYDISDYQDIMPEFGTLADWEELLAEMHRRRLKLLLPIRRKNC